MPTAISRVDVAPAYVDIIEQLMASELARSRVWLGGGVDFTSLTAPNAEAAAEKYEEVREYLRDAVIKIVGADGGTRGTVGDFAAMSLQGNTVDVIRRARRTRRGTTVSRLIHTAARRESRSHKDGGVYARRFKQAVVDHIASGAASDDVVREVT